jgi:hypothetical protein
MFTSKPLIIKVKDPNQNNVNNVGGIKWQHTATSSPVYTKKHININNIETPKQISWGVSLPRFEPTFLVFCGRRRSSKSPVTWDVLFVVSDIPLLIMDVTVCLLDVIGLLVGFCFHEKPFFPG